MTQHFPFNLPKNLERRYRYEIRTHLFAGTWRISYNLIGSRGALSLNIAGPYTHSETEDWSAGLEIHWRSPPDYMKEQPPSQDECFILKCPCWHDGTSLYAQDVYLPIVLRGDHKSVVEMLINEADSRFGFSCEEPE